jgi:hypothetical protein
VSIEVIGGLTPMTLNNTTPPEFPTFPYDDDALLQAIATIIAGILIFLTITPLATKGYPQIKHRNTMIICMTITLSIFMICVLLISFPVTPEESAYFGRGIARILFVMGLVSVIATISLFLQRITTQQKGEDL